MQTLIEFNQIVDVLHTWVGKDVTVTYAGMPKDGVIDCSKIVIKVKGMLGVDQDCNIFSVGNSNSVATFRAERVIMISVQDNAITIGVA